MLTLIRTGLAFGAGVFFAAPLFAQELRTEVVATYNGLNLPPVVHAANAPKNAFTYQYADREAWLKKVGRGVVGAKGTSPAVGVLDWVVPDEQFGTAGLDRQFRTYCAEAPVPVTPGLTYRFEIKLPDVPEAYKLDDTEESKAEAYRRSLYVRELFGRYFVPSLTDARTAKAFQIALWEIIHEPNWIADKPAPLDLDQGAFSAAKEQVDPEMVGLARTYLKTLTGNDNVFYENPDLAGRELVWMKGLESPQLNGTVAVAQSQFALQFVKGGAARTAIADPTGVPLGGGGVPLGGVGGGVFGGGAGGSGLYGGGAGGGGFIATPLNNIPPTTTTPPTTNVPPVNQPPTNPPDTPTNPVPAPAGIVLGAIAVGALFGRKALMGRR